MKTYAKLGLVEVAPGTVNRSITTSARVVDGGRVDFTGELHDTWTDGTTVEDLHHYRATLRAEGELLEVVAVEAEPIALPFGDCRHSVRSIDGLLGATLRSGFRRRVRDVIGGVEGCTHLGTLMMSMGDSAVPAGYLAARRGWAEGLAPDVSRVLDVCHGWRRDGAAAVGIRTGRGLPPRWSADDPGESR